MVNFKCQVSSKKLWRKRHFFHLCSCSICHFSRREFICLTAYSLWNFITWFPLHKHYQLHKIFLHPLFSIHLWRCIFHHNKHVVFEIWTCLLNPSKQTQKTAIPATYIQVYTGMLSTTNSAAGRTSTTRRK